MTNRLFFVYLLGLSVFTIALLLVQRYISALVEFTSISWISLFAFTLINVVMYFAASAATKSQNKGKFTSIFMMFTLLKMLFAVCLIILYTHYCNPSTNLFVFPFFLLYLIYTVFEVWFMTKLGKVEGESETARGVRK